MVLLVLETTLVLLIAQAVLIIWPTWAQISTPQGANSLVKHLRQLWPPTRRPAWGYLSTQPGFFATSTQPSRDWYGWLSGCMLHLLTGKMAGLSLKLQRSSHLVHWMSLHILVFNPCWTNGALATIWKDNMTPLNFWIIWWLKYNQCFGALIGLLVGALAVMQQMVSMKKVLNLQQSSFLSLKAILTRTQQFPLQIWLQIGMMLRCTKEAWSPLDNRLHLQSIVFQTWMLRYTLRFFCLKTWWLQSLLTLPLSGPTIRLLVWQCTEATPLKVVITKPQFLLLTIVGSTMMMAKYLLKVLWICKIVRTSASFGLVAFVKHPTSLKRTYERGMQVVVQFGLQKPAYTGSRLANWAHWWLARTLWSKKGVCVKKKKKWWFCLS